MCLERKKTVPNGLYESQLLKIPFEVLTPCCPAEGFIGTEASTSPLHLCPGLNSATNFTIFRVSSKFYDFS